MSADPIQSQRVGGISEKKTRESGYVYAIVGDDVRVTEIMRRGRDCRGY